MRSLLVRVTNIVLAMVLVFSIVFMATPGVYAASTLNGHNVVLDGSGKIIPWTADPNSGYDQVMALAWDYLANKVPNDPSTGKPAYLSQSYLNPDTQQMAGWPHNPAGLYGMTIESAIKYYAYSGNTAAITVAKRMADQQLSTGMTAASDSWASVPYASGDSGSLTYSGASYGNSTGVGDGSGYIEPDKIGEMAVGWIKLYEFDGTAGYRTAAVQAADVLAAKIRVGSATQSPWPFRVNAQTGAVREQYSAHIISNIELFDELIRLGIGNTASYQAARTTAWNWLMTYPIQNNVWTQYFEDVGVQSDYSSNRNQLNAMMVARYLLEHPEYDANWEAHVRGLISWVETNFKETDSGANIIREQFAFPYTMGSHTSRYASVNALLYEKTGDTAAKEKAYRSLNWATYMTRPNGVVIDGPNVGNQWFTDGYGDYVRHFMTSLGAVPEWSPAGQNHLNRSTSVVKNINYLPSTITYTTADSSATDILRLGFTPTSVIINGQTISQRSDLAQEGWTYDAANSILKIRHDSGPNVQISTGAPTNTAPSVTLTSPANGSTYTTPATILLAADASDADGTITNVDFYNGSTLLGSDTTAPYNFSWDVPNAGTYNLTARATDNQGAISSTAGISITLNAPTTLPSGWQTSDVGSVGIAGSATHVSGTFTVAGSGADIWGSADAFRYAYVPLSGDGEISGRVTGLQNTNAWAMAGVMMRESLAANSRHVVASVTYGNGLSETERNTTGGSSTYVNGGSGSVLNWVRVKRVGNVFTSYKSTDGVNWTQFAQSTITMGTDIYVGLAVSAVNNGALNTATFTNVSVGAQADTTSPTISSINTGTINQNGGTITWATNEPSDSQVEYGLTTAYGLTTSLNGSLVTSHSQVVSGLDAATTYHYRVMSRDAAGNLAVSGDNTFTTQAPPDIQAPTVPQNLSSVAAGPMQVDLSWTTSTDDTGVTGYKLFRDGTQIATTASNTYSDTTVFNNRAYTYTVVAYDAAGNTSNYSNQTVVTTPTFIDFLAPTAPGNLVAVANNPTQISLVWSASTDDVGVERYEIWRDGALLNTVLTPGYIDSNVVAETQYTYVIKAVDAAGNVSAGSNLVIVSTPANQTVSDITIGVNVVTKQSARSSSITSPTFSTTTNNEVLVAFIASDGGSAGQSFSTVTGGGLTWSLAKRVNTQRGTSEIWRAVAATPITNATVRATRSGGSYQGMINVVSFKGASTSIVGATDGANAGTGAASVSLVTTRPKSWVWAIGNDWDDATARTLGANQTKVNEYLSSLGDTFWVQRQNSVTADANTSVVMNTTAPTNHRWNMAAIEIVANQ